MGCSCHNGTPIIYDDTPLKQGGFAFKIEAEDPADLAPLSALINPDAPAQSALIRFVTGEFDHPVIGVGDTAQLEAALIPWIQGLTQ